MQKSYKVVPATGLSGKYDPRFIIVDAETGEILDDAQGYGYKSAQKAHAGYGYKTRDKSKDLEKEAKRDEIRAWLKKHKSFSRCMEQYAFEIAKGSWGPDDKFDAKLVGEMLKDYGYTDVSFTPGELLRCWKG